MTHSLRAATPLALATLLAIVTVSLPSRAQESNDESDTPAQTTDERSDGASADPSVEEDPSGDDGEAEQEYEDSSTSDETTDDGEAEQGEEDSSTSDETTDDGEAEQGDEESSTSDETTDDGEAEQGDEDSSTSDETTEDGESADNSDADGAEKPEQEDTDGPAQADDQADDGESSPDGQEADSDSAPAETPRSGDSPDLSTSSQQDTGGDEKSGGQQPDGKQSDDKQSRAQGNSPISGLSSDDGDEEFEPVEDIEEESLQEITPTEVFPYLEWDGLFRVRSSANVNLDLDTKGTSAILPPAETNLPRGSDNKPARSNAELLWSTDTELQLDPTIHITESLRLHVEAELLDNLVFGSLSDHRLTGATSQAIRPDPSRTVHSANQLFPREREWFEDSLRINEAYGEIDTFLGLFRAGRMDNDWGLGIAANGGDCLDCDYGDHVDRLQFRTNAFGIYGSAAVDFPDQGETTQSPQRIDGQPYDVSQVDDARQYTFSVSKRALSNKERKMRQKKLREDGVPVVSGGARFTLRNQKGTFVRGQSSGDGGDQDGAAREAELVYRGLDLYVPDLWGQFLYNPDPETLVRVELEAVGLFGNVDNTTGQPVGTASGDDSAVNCFDQSDRESSPEACSTLADGTTTDEGIAQLGGALESELYFGGPVRFGFNTGYASGGGSPNWGYGSTRGDALNFYRFDPNYHVDLILFREVVGTVTNAYYANPYAQARFFESPDRRMEVQVDAIASRAVASSGTPAGGENPWLGVELDGAVRYLQMETFQAGLEGGVLFPFGGLDSRIGERRLTTPLGMEGSENFGSGDDASIAWTIQGNLYWQF